MWFYLEFCTSCPVFGFKQPLLPCMHDSIRIGLIRYYPNQSPIAPPWQRHSGKLRAKLLLQLSQLTPYLTAVTRQSLQCIMVKLTEELSAVQSEYPASNYCIFSICPFNHNSCCQRQHPSQTGNECVFSIFLEGRGGTFSRAIKLGSIWPHQLGLVPASTTWPSTKCSHAVGCAACNELHPQSSHMI